MLYQTDLITPIGRLLIEGTRDVISSVRFVSPVAPVGAGCALLTEARRQLRQYFAGNRAVFALPLALDTRTPFQRIVLSHVSEIAYGQTSTYAEIARRIKLSTGPRAVGQANARNPIAIVIPCHRVIGANGKLTGYAGGIHAKEWLLRHEHALLA
jgi:methylated-DNA-[protein]-cysteine S-methyltransferase